ncbi:Predicted dehydrogenase [Sphaerochaeta associata]|uniref:Gfo/Idh/MocA family oxidoreductase n=1 Tax=Sphaerochaeta associata TaxID=1129264 RepID=A0ABY4DC83_9SPIR|nr:Gfo/Idh/MocA family oxidoreductase [Sphaerochaeta associata]UOM51871.1 Gfo/Idh/MocA family oxidoreductase [Sphaerochaeta associata]SMP58881.1 Predicted dehydrogenase [Sphaerochaeta associata]
MKELRIGVVSFEHMHAQSYTQELVKYAEVTLVGIADENEKRGREMAATFKTNYYQGYESLLEQQLDGVVICTNNRDHAKVSIAAAKKGIHILVEKPFATTIADAHAMLEAAREANVQIMNAFPMRFNPNVIAAKKKIDAGLIGQVLTITSINHGKIPGGWFIDPALSGGGAVMDHTVHLGDLIRWFTGSEIKSVFCESGELLHHKGIDDTGLVMIELDNGVSATIDCSWAHHTNYPIWAQVDMQIIGTKGVIELKAFAQVLHLDDQTNQRFEDIGWNETGDEGLIKEFVQVCATGRTPLVTGLDGLRALEIALASYESSRTNEVVSLA